MRRELPADSILGDSRIQATRQDPRVAPRLEMYQRQADEILARGGPTEGEHSVVARGLIVRHRLPVPPTMTRAAIARRAGCTSSLVEQLSRTLIREMGSDLVSASE